MTDLRDLYDPVKAGAMTDEENTIAFLEKLLADTEKSCQSERRAAARYLLLACILGAALVVALFVIGMS